MRIFLFFLISVGMSFAGDAAKKTTPAITVANLQTIFADGDTAFRDARFSCMRKGDNMNYAMPAFKSREEWQQYRQKLGNHILISTGLFPMPAKSALNVHVFDKTVQQDYTVEKVYFESYPGFFVTGNLYRPNGKTGPFPAILNPHGHWKEGRLENTDLNSGPGRCINFARQGYVVFNYDMVGYQDSKQLSHQFANTLRHQLWGINLMGLQLWNSIRSLDFVSTLADVDTSRIACTGESGGGTQTFMITAIDSRIKVAAPVNMVSAHFQGGCLCENAPGLRLHNFNVEIAAMTAPRPLLLVSTTQDWTRDNLTIEYPMIQSIYRWYDTVDRVACVQFDYPHNYNKDSREAVYDWFGRWLLGRSAEAPLKELPFTADPKEKLRVFSDEQKPPGDMTEEKLTAFLQEQAAQACLQAWPTNATQLLSFKNTYAPLFQEVLAIDPPQQVDSRILNEKQGRNFVVTQMVLSETDASCWIPALLYKPLRKTRGAAVVVHPSGKRALADKERPQPIPLVQNLLRSGKQVLLIDCFNTGEHIWANSVRDPLLKHFTTFNRTDCQEKVRDIVVAGRFFKDMPDVQLYGLEEAGLWALLAVGVSDDFDQLTVDAMGGSLNEESVLLQHAFMPGLARYGGLQTAAALFAPKSLTFLNAAETGFVKTIRQLYTQCGSEAAFTLERSEP